MFERLSYVGYTALFCLPPLVLLWLRREFAVVLRARLRPILVSTAVLTLYGSALWPLALERGAWAYGPERISGVELFGLVYVDDVLWWLLIGLLFSSFIALSTHYEDRGVDLILREIRGLVRSLLNAVRGLRVVPLERNSTIHVAAAVFVLLEGFLFGVTRTEWALIALAAGLVVAAELVNSAVERVADRTAPARSDPGLGLLKDVSAAAVLVAAAAAVAVGLAIFLSRTVAALR